MAKKLIVGNPRGIEFGVNIIRHKEMVWYAGDEFVRPKDMDESVVDDWTNRGFLLEEE